MTPIKARNHAHLKRIVQEHLLVHGLACDLNHIDVRGVSNLNGLFQQTDFNGDISQWDTSNVQDMSRLFEACSFNGDISKWNTANVTNMSWMFNSSQFTGDISGWNTSKVTNMSFMFRGSFFKGDISTWDTSKVNNMNALFAVSLFNGDISRWDLSSLEYYHNAFTSFNDSVLGYLGVIEQRYTLPNYFSQALMFQELWKLCEGLNMTTLHTAQYIYSQLHLPSQRLELAPLMDFNV